MEHIKWLDEVRIADADDVGDDAAVLGELLAGGLRVADGFVVVADALRQVVRDGGVDLALVLAERHAADRPAELDGLRERVRRSAPAACTSAQLVAAYRHLGARLGLLDPAVEVRSSPVGEHAGASRGVTETAVGSEAMIAAVQEVWSSLFDAQAISDRAALRIAGPPCAGVLVQEVVPVLRSGTAFSVDPLHRCEGVVFIAGAFGGGPDVWTGPPSDSYLVDRSTNEVVQTRLAAKDAEVVVRDGVATAVALSADRRHARVLSDEQAAQIGTVALAVESCLGRPQVVDWGLGTNGEVLVRAVRPLTMAPEG
jgi:phosphoenolpyruvate synthase/pyruvate phosphate dikinase